MSGPFGSTAWMANPASGFYPFEISNSLRLDSACETLLEKTNAASGGSAATLATLSCWFKYNVQDVESSQMPLIWNDSDASGIAFSQSSNTPHHIYVYWGGQGALTTAAVFRDPSAWYHIVAEIDSTQGTEANRLKLYINGVQVNWTGSFSQNTSSAFFNNNVKQRIGEDANNRHFSGYATDINAIEGTAYAASYFGEFKNDIWVPKNPSVTYGTNGFRLQFKNSGVGTASASTIGADTSGNTNHFTSTNIAANDQVPDNPTNNFCLPNPSNKSDDIVFSEGNTKAVYSTYSQSPNGTIGANSGKWYYEVKMTSTHARMGFCESHCPQGDADTSTTFPLYAVYSNGSNGLTVYNSVTAKSATANTGYTSFSDGDTLGLALDIDNGKFYAHLNGTYYTSGDPANGTGALITSIAAQRGGTFLPYLSCGTDNSRTFEFNFGAPSHAISSGNADENGYGNFEYAVPSGFLSLCTANLPDPVATVDPNKGGSPQDYFNSTLYTGTGSLLAVTTGFQPDWTWIKSRTTTDQHIVQDSVRGNFILYPDSTQAEGATGGGWVTETSTGFTADANGPINTSGDTYVAWNWKAGTAFSNDASATSVGSIDSSGSVNTDVGFSIIKWTAVGSSATQTIAHGLGAVPKMIIMKNRERSVNWAVYHLDIGNSHGLELNTNAAGASDSGWWNNTHPTSTVFTTGNGNGYRTGGIAEDYIAYCFAEVDGYSKIGKYSGNSNADGPFIHTGFRPAWLMFKKDNSTDDWAIHDSKRVDYGTNSNPIDDYLKPNSTASEGDDGASIDFYSNGFKWRINSGMRNNSGDTYIYMAFAEQPFKYANAR